MTANFQLHLGDCVEWLRTIDDESVALVVTDPAYESLEKHREKGTTTRLKVSDASSNAWFAIFRNERFGELMTELYRVLKPNAHAYVMSDEETAIDVTRPTSRAAGFDWRKTIVWVKTKGVDTGEVIDVEREPDPASVKIGMGYTWRASNERISFMRKGNRQLNHLGWPDVLFAPRIDKRYPTEKPVSLCRTLIENSSDPGDLVIDPFNGSASAGEACILSGRNYAGCDVARDAIEGSRTRLTKIGGTESIVLTPRRPRAEQRSLFG